MHQELKSEQISELEVFELNNEEVLYVAGGLDPEPENDPRN